MHNNSPIISTNNNNNNNNNIHPQYQYQSNTTAILSQQQPDINISNNLYRIKIDYLLDQKDRLEIQIIDLYKNNQLLRSVNQQIVKSQQQIQTNQQIKINNDNHDINIINTNNKTILALVNRNYQLEHRIKILNKQIKKLKDKIFICEQVQQQHQKDYKQIFTRYEHKIIDLRKLIQIKQRHIQVLQQSVSNGFKEIAEIDWVLPRAYRIQLFNKNQYLKGEVMYIQKKNQALINDNNLLMKQNSKLKEKIDKIQRLVSNNCSYVQYKTIMLNNLTKSLPKNSVKIQFKAKQNMQNQWTSPRQRYQQKNVNPETANQQRFKNTSTTLETRNRLMNNSDIFEDDVMVYKILKNKIKKITYLQQKMKKLQTSNAQQQKQIKKLIQSNKIYQKSRRNITQSCHLFENVCKILYDNLTRRKCNQITLKNQIHDDNQITKNSLLSNLTKSKKLVSLNFQQKSNINFINKQQWNSIKQSLNDHKPALIKNNQNYTRKRSQSCILDYCVSQIKFKQLTNINEKLKDQSIDLDVSNNFNMNFDGLDDIQINKKNKNKRQIDINVQDDFLDALDSF